MKVKNKNQQLKKIILLLSVLLASVLLVYWYIQRNTDTSSNDGKQNSKTTSTAPTAQESFSEGNERDPGNSVSENEGNGTIQENPNTTTASTDKSLWTKSTSGEITVYSPISGGVVTSGQDVSGESTLPAVSFRIIDNISGVIGEGQLTVKDGKFSGSLSFETSASKGRIDIFAVRPDGQEYSNIEIPITFK